MIEWKNFDSLESYGELAKAERVKLAEVMSGESGAETESIQRSHGSRHGL